MRIAFAGSPEFAATALQALRAAGHELVLVLTQPDRPAGRGLKLQPSPVKVLAQAHGLPLIQPRSLRLDGKAPADAESARQALQRVGPDVMVVAAYGLILPQWVLELPRAGCINIHASLLPRWRGAAPIQRAIEAGDSITGITLMQMDAGLDTGDMLSVSEQEVSPDDTSASLQDRLAERGARLIVEGLAAMPLVRTPQPNEGVCYAHKIDKREAPIDWRVAAQVIERRVRAFDPFPGASFQRGGEIHKLWRARELPRSGDAVPGTVLAASNGELVVACGEGALSLLQLQRPGGRRVDAAGWLQQHRPALGESLDQSMSI